MRKMIGMVYIALHLVAIGSHVGADTAIGTAADTTGEWRAPFTLAQPEHRYLITEDSPLWNCATMGNKICGGN